MRGFLFSGRRFAISAHITPGQDGFGGLQKKSEILIGIQDKRVSMLLPSSYARTSLSACNLKSRKHS
jgi:hypothetical protein